MLAMDELSEDALYNLKINIGIAIVVPTDKILEVLTQDVFAQDRKLVEERIRKERAPTLDVSEEGITQEEFKEALKKVSRPEEAPPDEEKTET